MSWQFGSGQINLVPFLITRLLLCSYEEGITRSNQVEKIPIPYLLKVPKEQNGSELWLVRVHVKTALKALKKSEKNKTEQKIKEVQST